MVLTLEGSSDYGAHIWNKSSILICQRYLVTMTESLNPIFSERANFTSYTCATFSELPSYVSTLERGALMGGLVLSSYF